MMRKEKRECSGPWTFPLHLSSVLLGFVLCASLAALFAYKWRNGLPEKERKKPMLRLCALIITLLAVERALRAVEIYFTYHAPSEVGDVFYHINNILVVGAVFTSMFSLMVMRLQMSFDGTAYELGWPEKRTLYTLGSVAIVSLELLWILDEFDRLKKMDAGKVVFGVVLFIVLSFGLLSLVKLDVAFASRLREIVVEHASYHSTNPKIHMSKQRTLNAVRNASVSSYDPSQQTLLRSASKSLVIAVLFTLSFLILAGSAILIALGKCGDWADQLGHHLIWLGFCIIGSAVSLSMPNFCEEYKYCCHSFDRWVSKIVAYSTDRHILQMQRLDSPSSNGAVQSV